jgi:UPF0755 protein
MRQLTNFIIKKHVTVSLAALFVAMLLLTFFQIYIPKSWGSSQELLFEVKSGTRYKGVAEQLRQEGLIRSSWFFKFYTIFSGNYGKIQAGTYRFSPNMSVSQIMGDMTSGKVARHNITIVEGWKIDEIANYVDRKGIYSKEDFISAVKKDFSDEFLFLKDKPKGASLEGYFFPDTYYLPLNSSPETLIRMALKNFDKKFNDALRQEAATNKKSVFQVITMASMIEREVSVFEDKTIVSGILWKRLENGVPLQVDATVNYVTGKNNSKVALVDTKIDSRYNTYKYYGLPQGPIANPGLESILAALRPVESRYWYYLSADGTGQTIFSKTLDEHNLAIAKYFKKL